MIKSANHQIKKINKIMYKEILRSMDDAGVFALVAIVIFFVFFVGLLVYVVRMKKSHVNHMASMPMMEDGSDIAGGTQQGGN